LRPTKLGLLNGYDVMGCEFTWNSTIKASIENLIKSISEERNTKDGALCSFL